jgi:hypothetical protein
VTDIISLIAVFAPLFSERVWSHAQVLLMGAILAPGKRTVSAILRVMGRSDDPHYLNFYRVLNRARWSTLQGSRILLGILVTRFVPAGSPILLGADDTVERRRGKKIPHVGCYRDAVRSSHSHVIRCFGLKWVSMQVLVRVPWSGRVWACPFLTALCRPDEEEASPSSQTPPPTKKTKKTKKTKPPRRTQKKYRYRDASGHKTSMDWIRQMLKQVRRWYRQHPLVLIVDGGLVSFGLGWSCVEIGATMVSRLRWDAALYHEPPKRRPPGKRGRHPKKGKRQRSLLDWAKRADTPWVEEEIDWYGGEKKKMWLFAHKALWYTPGWDPLSIRWVMVRDPEGKLRDEVFFSTDPQADPVQIVNWFVMRWSLEVTFEEVREHLGMETQHQWSDKAIQRTTPIVLGLYSIVTWITADLAQQDDIPIQRTAWYNKEKVTFSDCLFLVRKHIWQTQIANYVMSTPDEDIIQLTPDILDLLLIVGYPKAA